MWRLDGLNTLLQPNAKTNLGYTRLNLAYWCVFVCIGGFASIQLFRLRRSGLVAAAAVCGAMLTVGFAGAFLGLWPWSSRIAPWTIANAIMLGVVVTPVAARATVRPVADYGPNRGLRRALLVCGVPGYVTLLILVTVISDRATVLEPLLRFVGLLGLRSYFQQSYLMIYTALASLVAAPIGVGLWFGLIRREGRVSRQAVFLLIYVLAAGAAALPVIMSLGVLGLQFR